MSRNPVRTSVWSSAMTTRSGAPAVAASLMAGCFRWNLRWFYRHPCLHQPSPARPWPGGELAAVECDPFPQAKQAHPSTAGNADAAGVRCRDSGGNRPPVVGDLHHQRGRFVAEPDFGLWLPRMLDHVGEPFLHYPEHGQPQAGRQVPWYPGDVQFDGQAGGDDTVDHLAQLVETRLRRQADCTAWAAASIQRR